MTVNYVGIGPGSLLAARVLLRATFDRTVTGAAEALVTGDSIAPLRRAYDSLADALPSLGIGYVASPFNAGPGDTALTVDIRRAASGAALSASAVATALNNVPVGMALARLALVAPGEGSAAASANQAATVTAVQSQPGVIAGWLEKGQAVGRWFLWVLALAGILLLFLLFR